MLAESQALGYRYLIHPSVVASLPEFRKHEGYQIGIGNRYFAVGEVCLDYDLPWERPINARPDSSVWQTLFHHGLSFHKQSEMSVVVGMPHALVNSATEALIPRGEVEIEVYKDGSIKRKKVIRDVKLASECAAHALAFQNFYGFASLVCSIGFGTVELGACDKKGHVIEESLRSITYGLHHCAPLLRQELKSLGYERPSLRDDQYHSFDKILKETYGNDPQFCLRAEGLKTPLVRSDLLPITDRVLEAYAEKLIEQIQGYFKTFNTKMPIILTGGGTLYNVLIERLHAFFESQLYEVHIADAELSVLSAAIGYNMMAKKHFGENGVGIDIGNSSVVTILASGDE